MSSRSPGRPHSSFPVALTSSCKVAFRVEDVLAFGLRDLET